MRVLLITGVLLHKYLHSILCFIRNGTLCALLTGHSSNPNRSWLHSPEDHGAVLPVKGKVVDGDGASTAVDGRWQPVHTAVRRHQCIAVKCHLELSIHTADQEREEKETVVCWLIRAQTYTIFIEGKKNAPEVYFYMMLGNVWYEQMT